MITTKNRRYLAVSPATHDRIYSMVKPRENRKTNTKIMESADNIVSLALDLLEKERLKEVK